MDQNNVTGEFSVSAQITASDMEAVAEAGFRSIICNRPDGEGADQPTFEEIERAAEAQGLVARYQPVVSGKVRDEDVDDFAALIAEFTEACARLLPDRCTIDHALVARRRRQAAAAVDSGESQGRRLRHGRCHPAHRFRRQNPD